MITFKGLLYSCLDLGCIAVRMLNPVQILLARYRNSILAVLFLSITMDIMTGIILALYMKRPEVAAYFNRR